MSGKVKPRKIDWALPIRLVANKRQVYPVGVPSGGVRPNYRLRVVGVDNRWGSGGLVFSDKGHALNAAPPNWGEIENFDPWETFDLNVIEVPVSEDKLARCSAIARGGFETESERLSRIAREHFKHAVEPLRDHPLWGQF